MRRTRHLLLAALAITSLVALGACSSDDDADSTTTSTTEADSGSGESAATIRFDKEIQQELADVGCHPGAVDGIIGAQTDAAILAFQQADGITADGELGPETEAALKQAVAEGRTVCTGDATTTTVTPTTTPSGGTAPCTATALLEGLPAEGESIGSYVCSEGYAAGTLNDGTTKFLLQSVDGRWVAPSQDPCDSASAGIPAEILEDGCPAS